MTREAAIHALDHRCIACNKNIKELNELKLKNNLPVENGCLYIEMNQHCPEYNLLFEYINKKKEK